MQKILNIIFLISSLFISFEVYSQADISSISFSEKQKANIKFTSTKAYQILEIPVILATMGLASKPFDNKFKSIREVYIPKFDNSFDDYTQYLPVAVMLGLKTAGVKSRSSWGHMFTAYGFSIAITGGLAYGIKKTVSATRPDGSNRDTFPSGHTATAFMSAAMLHKEYGHLSIWYSIGGYALASVTGITRIMNNKHWMSDVFGGAAIGILSVELGYLIADNIFKYKQKEPKTPSNAFFTKDYKPSFFSFNTGVTLNLNNYTLKDGRSISLDTGAKIGVEGAWFINPYIGIGGQISANTSLLNFEFPPQHTKLSSISLITSAVGSYFSYPLSNFWRVGSKALVGINYANLKEFPATLLSMDNYNISFQTGISISYFAKRNLGFKLYTDYGFTPSFIGSSASNVLTFGLSIDLLLSK